MHRDPLLDALIGKLPAPGESWPQPDRDVWFNLMRSAFDLVYGRDGQAAAKPAVIEIPKLPLLGDETPATVPPGRWHVDAGGIARAPDGEEAPLEGTPRGTVLMDFRPEGDRRIDTVIWADGTWPAGHVRALGIKLEARLPS